MSDVLVITLSSNAAEIVAALGRFTPAMQQAIAKALDLQNELSIGAMQRNKLSGPRPDVLGVVSNRLRSSIRKSNAVVSEMTAESAIGSNVKYAGVHEFGFDSTVQVSAFSRKVQTRNQTEVGVAQVSLADGRIRRRKTAKRTASGVAFVKAHSRHMKMPKRSFIFSTITEREADYSKAVSAAIESAWPGGAS